jgi:hypothetical protein
MDGALEAVEDMSRAGHPHLEGLVVLVSADFALSHGTLRRSGCKPDACM